MHEALGALTVALADSPTTHARRALPESSTEGAFAEVLADSPITQGRRALPESTTESAFAEVLADSPTTQDRRARPESTTESTFADVLAEVMSVERVSVDSNFFDDLGADSMVMARFCARVRKRPDLPSVSIKDIYQHPTIRSLATALTDAVPVPAPMPFESTFADVLAEVMSVERVSVDSNFFDDLGADSMVMARFCARVRKRPDLPAVSIKDVYQHPTIASLATALADAAPIHVESPFRIAGYRPIAGCNLGRGAQTGENMAGSPLRGAAAVDLPRILLSRRTGHRTRLRVDLRRHRCARHLPPISPFRLRIVPLPVHRSDPGEVDPDRSLEASADPHLEPGVRALLGRQDAGPAQPDHFVHRFAAVQPVPAGTGREGRPRRCDLVQPRADLHRPAHHRRRHGHP